MVGYSGASVPVLIKGTGFTPTNIIITYISTNGKYTEETITIPAAGSGYVPIKTVYVMERTEFTYPVASSPSNISLEPQNGYNYIGNQTNGRYHILFYK